MGTLHILKTTILKPKPAKRVLRLARGPDVRESDVDPDEDCCGSDDEPGWPDEPGSRPPPAAPKQRKGSSRSSSDVMEVGRR